MRESGAFPGQQPHLLTTGSQGGRPSAKILVPTGSGHTLVNDQVAVIHSQGSCGDEVRAYRLRIRRPVLAAPGWYH